MTDWGFQLYSARSIPLRQSLDIIAAAGYTHVEAIAANFDAGDEFRTGLDACGLTVQSMHVSRECLTNSIDDAFEQCRQFGVHHIVMPYIKPDERPTDVAGWTALAAELTTCDSTCRDAGFKFAYHNHDFEFFPLDDGTIPMRLLLDGAPGMHWEIDIAWIVRAGAEPAAWVDDYLERISAVHMKDVASAGECADEDGWADVGHGVVDWPGLLPRLRKSPASLFIMEHDNPSDVKRFASRSIERANTW